MLAESTERTSCDAQHAWSKWRATLAARLRGVIRDRCGQDMVEYALLAGFLAVSAGALLPGVADPIISIFSKVGSLLEAASEPCPVGPPGTPTGGSFGCGPPTAPGT